MYVEPWKSHIYLIELVAARLGLVGEVTCLALLGLTFPLVCL